MEELRIMATTIEYQVTGMSCGHCETAIRAEVSEIDGVIGIDVNAQTGRLAVTSEQPVDEAAVIAAVDEAGYAAATS
jgi:copper chaperone